MGHDRERGNKFCVANFKWRDSINTRKPLVKNLSTVNVSECTYEERGKNRERPTNHR